MPNQQHRRVGSAERIEHSVRRMSGAWPGRPEAEEPHMIEYEMNRWISSSAFAAFRAESAVANRANRVILAVEHAPGRERSLT